MELVLDGLGRRLRALRRARRVTLEQLAADTGFTPGYLSRIETGATIPALSALAELAAALGADMTALFPADEESKVRVSRAGDAGRLRIESDPDIRYTVLASRGSEGAFSALLATYAPGAQPVPYRHFGERFMFVRSGHGVLEFGGERIELAPGSFVHYSSHVEHSLAAAGGGSLETLWLVSPPII